MRHYDTALHQRRPSKGCPYPGDGSLPAERVADGGGEEKCEADGLVRHELQAFDAFGRHYDSMPTMAGGTWGDQLSR